MSGKCHSHYIDTPLVEKLGGVVQWFFDRRYTRPFAIGLFWVLGMCLLVVWIPAVVLLALVTRGGPRDV